MKTTIDLPNDLIREVKLRAVMQGRTVRELVATLLRQGLGMEPAAQGGLASSGTIVQVGANGLPVVRCSANAPAKKMSLEKLLALEHQSQTVEDLQRAGITL